MGTNNKITINSGALVGFGGIVGCAGSGSSIGGSEISANIRVGVASTSADWTSYGIALVGGYVGYHEGDSILGLALTKKADVVWVNNNYCGYQIAVYGSYFIGGIIGYADGSKSLSTTRTYRVFRPNGWATVTVTEFVYNIIAYAKTTTYEFKNPSLNHFNSNASAKSGTTCGNIGPMSNDAWYYVHVNGTASGDGD